MSLKNDIEMVKEELNAEEKFFEKAVVTEKFVKKYKKAIIGSVVAVVVLVAGNIGYTISENNRLAEVNSVLSELQTKSTPALEARLDSLSPTLSDVWHYSQAVVNKDLVTLKKLEKSKAILIGDLASYEAAQNANDLQTLESYANSNEAVYADLARVEAAILLMNEKKIDEAHQKLSLINVTSPLAQVAKALMHYGVK